AVGRTHGKWLCATARKLLGKPFPAVTVRDRHVEELLGIQCQKVFRRKRVMAIGVRRTVVVVDKDQSVVFFQVKLVEHLFGKWHGFAAMSADAYDGIYLHDDLSPCCALLYRTVARWRL